MEATSLTEKFQRYLMIEHNKSKVLLATNWIEKHKASIWKNHNKIVVISNSIKPLPKYLISMITKYFNIDSNDVLDIKEHYKVKIINGTITLMDIANIEKYREKYGKDSIIVRGKLSNKKVLNIIRYI